MRLAATAGEVWQMLITWQVRANDGAHLYHCAVRSDVVNASLRARPHQVGITNVGASG